MANNRNMQNNMGGNNQVPRKQKKDKYRFGIFFTKIYRVIPKNCVLIVRNKYSGKRVTFFTEGHAWVAPWKEAKLISVAERTIDYEKMEFDDKDGQAVFVDFAVTVKITDPIAYEYSHMNPEQALKVELQSLMRTLIKKATWEEMSKEQFSIHGRNVHSSLNNQAFNDGLAQLSQQLNSFARQYGLSVTSLVNKDIQQSPEMQKAYDEKVRKQKEGEAALEEAKYRKLRAEKEQEIKIIEAKAQAAAEIELAKASSEKLKIQLMAIKEVLSELPKDYVLQVVANLAQTYLLTNGSNKNINVISGVKDSNDLLKVAVAKTSSDQDKTVTVQDKTVPVEENNDQKAPKEKKK